MTESGEGLEHFENYLCWLTSTPFKDICLLDCSNYPTPETGQKSLGFCLFLVCPACFLYYLCAAGLPVQKDQATVKLIARSLSLCLALIIFVLQGFAIHVWKLLHGGPPTTIYPSCGFFTTNDWFTHLS